MKKYRVKQGTFPGVWYVWDNQKNQEVKTVPTRKEARRVAIGMNAGWINEVEEEKGRDSAA